MDLIVFFFLSCVLCTLFLCMQSNPSYDVSGMSCWYVGKTFWPRPGWQESDTAACLQH